MPKKTRDEFKAAFKVMKKPGRPKNVSGKIKGDLEKAANDDERTTFIAKIDEIENLDHGYLVDLVAYKLGKHFENDSKMPSWHNNVPPAILTEALTKIVPGDLSDPGTKRMMDKSMADGDMGRVGLLCERDGAGAGTYFGAMPKANVVRVLDKAVLDGVPAAAIAAARDLYARDPDAALKYLLDQKEDATVRKNAAREASTQARLGGNEAEQERQDKIFNEQSQRETQLNGALSGVLGGANVVKESAKYLMRANNPKATRQLMTQIGSMPAADVREIAATAPDRFIEEVLAGVSTTARMKLLSDPALRRELEANAKDEWDEFVTQVPVLRLYDSVSTARAQEVDSGDRDTEQLKNVQALFDTMMDGDQVAAAYVGTKTGNPSEIMAKTGPVDTDNPPRTDCHNMLMVMNATIQGYPGMMPGLGEKLKWGHCSNMLMTKKLSEIGVDGRGLIDKKFSGNVFDEAGTATGQILFTGESGVNSHSWLEAGGLAFDPVLGISGTVQAVKDGSTFATFDWVLVDLVGRGTGGWYFVKDDASIVLPSKARLKVADNPMSFATAYYLTKNPERILTPEALQRAKIG